MKKLFVVLMLSLFSSVSFAAYESCAIMNTGLPESVVQKLKTDCENLRLEQIQKEATETAASKAAKAAAEAAKAATEQSAPLVTPEKITSWATVATGLASAVGSAAKEIGISVNEFIKTPAGIIILVGILFKAFGSDIAKIGVLIFLTFSVYFINRHLWTAEFEPVKKKFAFIEWESRRRVFYTWKQMDEKATVWSWILTAVYLVVFTLITLHIG